MGLVCTIIAILTIVIISIETLSFQLIAPIGDIDKFLKNIKSLSTSTPYFGIRIVISVYGETASSPFRLVDVVGVKTWVGNKEGGISCRSFHQLFDTGSARDEFPQHFITRRSIVITRDLNIAITSKINAFVCMSNGKVTSGFCFFNSPIVTITSIHI